MGMQIPCCYSAEISAQGDIREVEEANRGNTAGIVSAARCRTVGGACDVGPCPHVFEYSSEIQRRAHGRVSERKKCGQNTSAVVKRAADDGTSFLGDRILCEHCWSGRSKNPKIHSRAGAVIKWSR